MKCFKESMHLCEFFMIIALQLICLFHKCVGMVWLIYILGDKILIFSFTDSTDPTFTNRKKSVECGFFSSAHLNVRGLLLVSTFIVISFLSGKHFRFWSLCLCEN